MARLCLAVLAFGALAAVNVAVRVLADAINVAETGAAVSGWAAIVIWLSGGFTAIWVSGHFSKEPSRKPPSQALHHARDHNAERTGA